MLFGGFTATWAATRILLPLSGGNPNTYWLYPALGHNIGSAVLHTLRHPLSTLRLLFHPAAKAETLRGLFLPLVFAPLASPLLIPAIPLLAERMLSNNPNWWSSQWHYNAFVIVPLICGGVDTVRRIKNFLVQRGLTSAARQVPLAWAALATVLTLVTVPDYPLGNLYRTEAYRETAQARTAQTALAHIPPGVWAEVPTGLGPALTQRDTVISLRPDSPHAPWVIVNTLPHAWQSRTLAQQQELINTLVATGYQIIYADRTYTVLHQTQPPNP
jgi:hypothetical protein